MVDIKTTPDYTQEPALFGEQATKTVRKPIEPQQQIGQPTQHIDEVKLAGQPIQAVQPIEQPQQRTPEKDPEPTPIDTEQKKKKVVDEFKQKLDLGASQEDLVKFVQQNQQYKDYFSDFVKEKFKSRENAKFYNKYSGLDNELLLQEVKKGELVPGSERYKLLPEPQRNAFEDFMKQQEAGDIFSKKQFTEHYNIVSTDKADTIIDSIFTSNIIEKAKNLLNTPEINKLASELANKKTKIEKLDISMEDIDKRITKEMAGDLPGVIRARINDERSVKIKEKRMILAEYNAKLGEYQTLKDNALQELDYIKYDDQINIEKYKAKLDLYEKRRGEMKADDIRKFQEENKRLAEERQFNFNKRLTEFRKDLEGGKYIDNGKGDLVYIKDGEIINTLSGLGKTIATSETPDYSYNFKKNYDGTYTVLGTPKKKGLEPTIEVRDISGEQSGDWLVSTGTGSKDYGYGGAYDNWQGLDIPGNKGQPITTPVTGTVIEALTHPLYGNTVVIKDEQGNMYRYSHLDQVGDYKVGDTLETGTVVGTFGNTGNVLTRDSVTGELRKPTKEELKQGRGTHLDLTTYKPDGAPRGSYQTKEFMQGLGKDKEVISPEMEIATGIVNGMGDLSDLTPTDKKQILPLVKKEIESRFTEDKNRNLIVQSALEKKEVSDKTAEKIQDMQTVKFQFNAIEKRLSNMDTGPVLGAIKKFNYWDTDAQVAMAQLAGLTPKVARGIFGEVGVLTDTDIRNYQRALPNITSTDEKNVLIVDFMRKLLAEGYKNAIVTQAKAGRNVGRFLSDYDELTKKEKESPIKTSSGFEYKPSTEISNFFNN